MADLSSIDKQILEQWFQMKGWYVLDFSNRTMLDFFHDDVGINIYDEKYSQNGESKASRMRSFWTLESNQMIAKSIIKLIEYIETKIAMGYLKQIDFPDARLKEWKKIWMKLLEQKSDDLEIKPEIDLSQEIGKHLKKAEDEIKKTDYDWAIGTLSTFLEEFFEWLHIKITWESLWESADLKKDFVKIKNLLNLVPDWHADQLIKQMLMWFSQIVDAIDRLCNSMWDRHRKLKDKEWKIRIKPLKHHALLMLNSVKTLTWFLNDSYEYQIKKKEISNFPLPAEVKSFNELIQIIKSFPGDHAIKIWNKLFKLSLEWIVRLRKIYIKE